MTQIILRLCSGVMEQGLSTGNERDFARRESQMPAEARLLLRQRCSNVSPEKLHDLHAVNKVILSHLQGCSLKVRFV